MASRDVDRRFAAYEGPIWGRTLDVLRDSWSAENQTSTAVFACALLLVVVATLFGGASQGNALSLTAAEAASLPLLFVGLYLTLAGTAPKGAIPPLILLALIVAVPILQLVPLPASIWTRLPGRGPVGEVMDVAHLGRPALPFSLSPQDTYRSLLALAPPAAMLIGGVFLDRGQRRVLAVLWLLLALVSLGFGILQLIEGPDSRFYFYDITNPGSLVGLFSNRNNEAVFFYSLMPFAAVFAAQFRGNFEDRRAIPAVLAALYFLIAIVGVLATRSRAGVAITAVALLGSVAVIVRSGALRRHWRAALGIGLGSLLVLGAVLLFGLGPVLDRFSSSGGAAEPRFTGWPIVIALIGRFMPWGSGVGSFPSVYMAAEPLRDVSPIYFNHAHNDYLELLLETGVVGVVLFVLFAAWLIERLARIWTSRGDDMAAACTLVILLPMAHSLVEYPLRTEAIAVLFAFACSTIAVWRPGEQGAEGRRSERRRSDQRRHHAAVETRTPAEAEPQRASGRRRRRVRVKL